MFDDYDIIYTYTRKQAIEDGVLVDVTSTAREAGFRFPVALTRAVWENYVRVPEGVEGQTRRADFGHPLYAPPRRQAITEGRRPSFQLHVRNDNQAPRPVTLKAVCGPGDDGSPCITVMMPDED